MGIPLRGQRQVHIEVPRCWPSSGMGLMGSRAD